MVIQRSGVCMVVRLGRLSVDAGTTTDESVRSIWLKIKRIVEAVFLFVISAIYRAPGHTWQFVCLHRTSGGGADSGSEAESGRKRVSWCLSRETGSYRMNQP